MTIDPDSPENQAATRQHEREVFALQMQAKPRCICCGNLIDDDPERALCDECRVAVVTRVRMTL